MKKMKLNAGYGSYEDFEDFLIFQHNETEKMKILYIIEILFIYSNIQKKLLEGLERHRPTEILQPTNNKPKQSKTRRRQAKQ